MALALATAALVLMALLWLIALPSLRTVGASAMRALNARVRHLPEPAVADGYDPGRELRAEQRARVLLRSCVNEEEWAMYSELGFLRVWGSLGRAPSAYLVYPHKPILAYDPRSGSVQGEYCVEFPDRTRPYGSSRLPDADDMLAKWMALNADERSLIEQANMHLPGRQIRVTKARRDLVRLACWEREQSAAGSPGLRSADGAHG
ncbi:MAG TPA: hypothetical protein VNU24_07745 [Solirubrobacteraceae bacterium]|jgi:hypothetical protein|nr:hypothetical protein [Solirubrobacteraceae bacterium]